MLHSTKFSALDEHRYQEALETEDIDTLHEMAVSGYDIQARATDIAHFAAVHDLCSLLCFVDKRYSLTLKQLTVLVPVAEEYDSFNVLRYLTECPANIAIEESLHAKAQTTVTIEQAVCELMIALNCNPLAVEYQEASSIDARVYLREDQYQEAFENPEVKTDTLLGVLYVEYGGRKLEITYNKTIAKLIGTHRSYVC